MSDRTLLRKANEVLLGEGKRWCYGCAHPSKHRDRLLAIINRERYRTVKAILPIEEFRFWSNKGVLERRNECDSCRRARQNKLARKSRARINALARASYARRKAEDPEYLERHNAACRAATRRRLEAAKQDPEVAEILKGYSRSYRERLYADPERLAIHNEHRRMHRRAKRLEQGLPVRKPARVSSTWAVVPVGPFREWLKAAMTIAIARGIPVGEFAGMLQTPERTLYRIINENLKYTQVQIVDKCIHYAPFIVTLNESGAIYSLGNLYGERVPLGVRVQDAGKVFGDSWDGAVLG